MLDLFGRDVAIGRIKPSKMMNSLQTSLVGKLAVPAACFMGPKPL
jgi:hypothetical protein